MGAHATYFSTNFISNDKLTEFLKSKYKEVSIDISSMKLTKESMDTIIGNIRITLPSGNKINACLCIPGYDSIPGKNSCPVQGIAGKYFTIEAASDKECIDVLFTIAKEFGGYIQQSDNALDENGKTWEYISGKKETSQTALEGKLFTLISEYNKRNGYRSYANIYYIIGFIIENMEELKKL